MLKNLLFLPLVAEGSKPLFIPFLMQLPLRCFASPCVVKNPSISISFGMLLVTVLSIIKVHSSPKRKHQSAAFSEEAMAPFTLPSSSAANVSLVPAMQRSLQHTLYVQFNQMLHALQCINPRIEGPYSAPPVKPVERGLLGLC